MRTTSKKDMELYYSHPPGELRPVIIYTGATVYIQKDADLSRLIRMYKSNGRAIVEKRHECVEYSPVMLHPENITDHAPKEALEKELHRLQRDLNSSRLLSYIPGDTSEAEQNRQKERAEKLARFHEILDTLNGKG
jgi:valyl-tRNA synthetase